MDLAKIKGVGVDLGYEGVELREFVKAQQDAERQERKEEREAAREREERDATRERKERHLKVEAMKHEENMLAARESADASLNVTGQTHCNVARNPKLPCFSQDRDDIDDYIMRFERHAVVQGWQEDSYAVCLGALLTGKALEVYSRIPISKVNDYHHLKNSLLARFQMTCDDFRRKFITSKQSATESPPQFLARLEHYLLRWIALSKTAETFQSLRDLMLREQFMSSVSRELSIFLRENAADDLDVMSELANKFTMARAHVAYREPAAGKSRQSPIKSTHEARGSQARTQYSSPRCFSCGNTGHLRNSCPNSERRFVGVRGRQDERYRENGGGSGKPRGPDHRNKPVFGNAAVVERDECHECSFDQRNAKLQCGCCLPIVAGSCSRNCRELPICDGYVNGIPVKVLRDTGCTAIIVKRSLVKPEDLTGEIN